MPALGTHEVQRYMAGILGWQLEEDKLIKKEFRFKDFAGAMAFVNKAAALAENEGHHPTILILYNKVRITLSTHAASGLSENDFIMAAKIDRLLSKA